MKLGIMVQGLLALAVIGAVPNTAWADPPSPEPPAPVPSSLPAPPQAPSSSAAAVSPPATPAAPAPTQPSSSPPVVPPPVSRYTVALGAAGIAAAGAIGATVFGVLALQNKSSYDQNPTYANTDNGNNFAAYSDGCIALAIAAGVTSLVLYLTGTSSVDSASATNRAALFFAFPVTVPRGAGEGAGLHF